MSFASASFVLAFLVFDLAMTLNCNSLRFAKAYSRHGETLTKFAHESTWKFLNHQSYCSKFNVLNSITMENVRKPKVSWRFQGV